jgi:hypothetical protein
MKKYYSNELGNKAIVEIIFDTLKQLEYIIKKRIRKISKIQFTMTLIPFAFELK